MKTTFWLTMAAAAAVVTGAFQGVHAAPVVPSEPTIGWLLDEQSTAEEATLANAWGPTNMTLEAYRPGGAGTEMTVTDTPYGLPGQRAWSTLEMGDTRWAAWNYTNQGGVANVPHLDTALAGAPAITVSIWVKLDEYVGALQYDNKVMECMTDVGFLEYLRINIRGDDQRYLVAARSGTGEGLWKEVSTTVTNTLDEWHQIVAILDFANDEIRVAIDGGALETFSTFPFLYDVFTPGPANSGYMALGTNTNGERARGLTDEVAFWKYALSQDEISWLYQNSLALFPPPGMATLAVGSGVGGSTAPAGVDYYPAGTSVTVTATADTGYVFTGWTGDVVSATNPLPVTLTNTVTSITPEFGPDLADPDVDGLTTFEEAVIYGTNPNAWDTTGDGIGDGEAVNAAVSPSTSYTGIVSVVQGRPADFDLYDETSIHDLNMGGLLIQEETGVVSVAFVLEESTNSVDWTVYEEFLRDIVMPVDKAWLRLLGEERFTP